MYPLLRVRADRNAGAAIAIGRLHTTGRQARGSVSLGSSFPGDRDNLHLGHILRQERLRLVASIAPDTHDDRKESHQNAQGNCAMLGLGGGVGIKGILAVDVLDGAIGHKGRTVALGESIAIRSDPVGKEDVEDHCLAGRAVWSRHLARLANLDETNVIGGCLDDRHVVGFVDGTADATFNRSGDAVEPFLSLDRSH